MACLVWLQIQVRRLRVPRVLPPSCAAQVLASWEASPGSIGGAPWWLQLLTLVARRKDDPGARRGWWSGCGGL